MKSQETITNEEFSQFLRGVRMKEIWIESSECQVFDRKRVSKSKGKELIEFGYATKLDKTKDNEAQILVLHGVRLFAEPTDPEIEPKDDDELARLSVEYRVVYETPCKLTKAMYEQLSGLSLRLHTTPFARDWLHGESVRMGLRPLLMPLALSHPVAAAKATPRQEDESRVGDPEEET